MSFLMHLGAVELPALHVLLQQAVPVRQDVVHWHALQQAPHLHYVFVPAQ